MEVFTEEWNRACCERLNGYEPYRAAAAKWEGAIVMVMRADPRHGVGEDRASWFDLHHGACRGARIASEADREKAPFVMSAPPPIWREILSRELEPIPALMFGKLKLERGSLFTLARFSTAAREMVVAASQVEATFPASQA